LRVRLDYLLTNWDVSGHGRGPEAKGRAHPGLNIFQNFI
jgi:hypothetical protein